MLERQIIRNKPDFEKARKRLRESYKKIYEEKQNNTVILIIDNKTIHVKNKINI